MQEVASLHVVWKPGVGLGRALVAIPYVLSRRLQKGAG